MATSFEKRDLNGKVVLVTGGSRGIGHHFCKKLLEVYPGVKLVITGRRESAVQEAAHVLRTLVKEYNGSATVEAVQCDQTNREEIKRLAEFIREKFGRLDVLINNAGVMPGFSMGMEDVSDELDLQCLRVNIDGYYFMTKYMLNLLFVPCDGDESADFEKTVVLVSSSSAYLTEPEPCNGMISYHMSKTAENGLMMALHQTYTATENDISKSIQKDGTKRLGRVVSINPGFVQSGLGRENWQDASASDQEIAKAKSSFGAISLDDGIDTLFYVTCSKNGTVQSGKIYDKREIHSF